MPDEREVYAVFRREGFADLHEIVKTARFTDPSSHEHVYLNRDRLPRCIHVYLHPELDDPNVAGAQVVGDHLVAGRRVQFRSNLTAFPKALNRGQTECHYGKGVVVDNLATLSEILRWVRAHSRP
jgi:hypothetical protein